ncbi:inositol phospholipid synthesis and fat-storage-inducing TM-domain-containing protein [Xylariaceae sp. FL0804]|nr:inositol phospholipid synthesis and fat-storage-inducing TM-domain-containing protein [Xylariaceae sp. FL0804]
MADSSDDSSTARRNGFPPSPTHKSGRSIPTMTDTTKRRNSPYLPTPLETLALAVYPMLLTFGTLFSVLSPETRASPYDAGGQSHVQAQAPSYFARKNNLFNVLFVKRGWAWVTVAFAAFALSHPALRRRARGALMNNNNNNNVLALARAWARWALVTGWWILVTQWCFGPPIIDRGFRYTGGRCAVAVEALSAEEGLTADTVGDALTAAACRASGGRWSGGHDISGHVFLLVLGSAFLLQEVGWVALRARAREERSVVMPDGAVKGAGVEAAPAVTTTTTTTVTMEAAIDERDIGLGGKFAAGVVVMCWWMLLMTAIYFHTWFEKFTGLMTASLVMYPIYILPRWLPALRAIIGLPGI